MNRRTWTLITVILGSGIVFLDATVVNVALKSIGEQLPATLVGVLEGQSYVVNGYLLTLSALLILAGALADRYGRRLLFVVGLAGFGAASLLCGLAPSMELLIVARLVQGASGALLVPTSLALINAEFEGAERGQAFGVWAAATSGLQLIGPPVGGFLVDTLGWRAAFLVNVPLVALGVAMAAARVRESRNPGARGRLDLLGALAVALAVGGLAYGAIRGEATGWTDPSAPLGLLIGATCTLALVPLMTRRRDVLVPPSLFRSRNFTVTNVSTLLIYGALYVYGYFFAIFIQGTVGYTATAAGLAGILVSVALVALSTTFGRLAGRRGPRLFMSLGPAVMGLGLLWYVRMPPDSAAWRASLTDPASLLPPLSYLVDVLPSVVVFALGLSMLVAPLTTALMSSVPVGNSGLASAINNAISRVGPLLATALIFIAVSATFYAGIEARVPGIDTSAPEVRRELPPLNPPGSGATPGQAAAARESSTDAFRLAMLIAAGLCAAGAAVNWLGIRDPAARQA